MSAETGKLSPGDRGPEAAGVPNWAGLTSGANSLTYLFAPRRLPQGQTRPPGARAEASLTTGP